MIRAAVAALLLLSTACWGATARFSADLIGPMDGENLAGTYKQILDAPEGSDVALRINSPGGNLLTTLLFIDLVRDEMVAKHKTVTCVVTGLAASAAAIVLESPACTTRWMEPQAVLMFHEGYLSGGGPVKQDDKEFMRSLNFSVAALIAPRMGMSPEAYLAWIKDGVERWLTAPSALELHFVDRVAVWDRTVEKDSPPPL